MRKHFYRFLVLCAVTLGAACASGPTIRIDKDPAANMASYKTFGFYDQLATDRHRYSTIMTARLKQSTRAQLQRLGYTYDEVAPQLRVNFFVKVTDKQQIRSSPVTGFYGYRGYRAWGGYPHNIESVDYQAGTLSVDLVDAKTNALVWQGLALGKVKKQAYKDPAATIDAVIADIFERFPEQPRESVAHSL